MTKLENRDTILTALKKICTEYKLLVIGVNERTTRAFIQVMTKYKNYIVN